MIKIPCFFANDESRELETKSDMLGLDFDVNLDDIYSVEVVYFFEINYVFKHPNGEHTMIGSGVEDFRSPWPIDKITKLLK